MNNAPGDWYDRYMSGDTVGVWKEMSPHRLMELDDARRFEAHAVIAETTSRIVQNIDLLAARLKQLGYKPFATLVARASSYSRGKVKALDGLLSLPESLKAFYEAFEEIDFIGELQ